MQGIGAITAVLAAYTLTAFLSPEVAWRLLLGLGALPPMCVVFLRRRIPETPRYSLLVARNHEEAVRGLRMVIGGSDGDFTSRKVKIEYSINTFSDFLKRFWEPLFIASSTWFLMDVAFYGTGIYSGFIVSGLIQRASLQSQILMAGIPYFVGGFGYFFAAFLMDSMGRKRIQIQGFLAMAAIYTAVALSIVAEGSRVKELALPRELAFLIYSVSFFFINFGPNETTFVLPTELFPTKFRSTAHGIASASGKAGAAVSTYLMPMLLNSIGIRGMLFLLSGVSLLGALISMGLKETAGLVLEEASKEKELLKIAA